MFVEHIYSSFNDFLQLPSVYYLKQVKIYLFPVRGRMTQLGKKLVDESFLKYAASDQPRTGDILSTFLLG